MSKTRYRLYTKIFGFDAPLGERDFKTKRAAKHQAKIARRDIFNTAGSVRIRKVKTPYTKRIKKSRGFFEDLFS